MVDLSNPPAVQRVLVHAGHGLSNKTVGVFDNGASSQYGREAGIVDDIVTKVVDAFWLPHDQLCDSPHKISVIPTPRCSDVCGSTHRTASHLSVVIEWVNEVALKVKGGYVDIVLSVHMDSLDAKYSGPLVVIDDRAGVGRYHEAQEIAKILAQVLGLPNRGVITDRKTPRGSIAIVEKTNPPAFLLELGNIQNERDALTVRECGAQAVIAVIKALEKTNRFRIDERSRAVNRGGN